ncbi:hypothetical protein [Sporosarcina highlanderae]|uniref:Yip1 domain-containing protein n=1 Tax=Sporosarcina highlanderae TaxID=3035916 RepID=A0ABT8JLL7_9BACL|nr:hypothetical protein [Sporosarcina highlanderae]MDN4605970.1 hypothetical protein [Sporosarcina highlanderae]
MTKPDELALNLQTGTMRNFTRRLIIVLLTGILLFSLRNIWGMNTETLTSLMVSMTTTDYILARFASLIGTIIWSVLYIGFHIFGIALILSGITKIPYHRLVPLQVLIIGILLMEKAVLFIVFTIKGVTVNLSFLSFGPLAATVMENWYLILFLNQLTITSALIITLQYRFISAYLPEVNRKASLMMLVGLHIAMALITASVAFIPFNAMLNSIFGGGF